MKIAMILDGTVSAEIRLACFKPYLEKYGHKVIVVEREELYKGQSLPGAHVAIFSRPHNWDMMNIYKENGALVIADIDDDFWTIPREHVAYNFIGPGNKETMGHMEKSLQAADIITVSTEVLADRMSRFGHPVSVIHNGWDDTNQNWHLKKASLAKPIIIGWAGTITHREDFKQVVTPLVELVRKYPDVGVLIGSDYDIYKSLYKIPESNKWFIPMLPYQLYPTIFRYIDIWLAPLVLNTFNEAKSDIKLLEGSVRGIPSVVSPAPAYTKWNHGTLFARSEQEWTQCIERLICSPEERRTLGAMNLAPARERTMAALAKEWIKVIS